MYWPRNSRCPDKSVSPVRSALWGPSAEGNVESCSAIWGASRLATARAENCIRSKRHIVAKEQGCPQGCGMARTDQSPLWPGVPLALAAAVLFGAAAPLAKLLLGEVVPQLLAGL